MKDVHYVKLFEMASAQGLSMGKLLNIMIGEYCMNDSKKADVGADKVCEICGKEVFYECFLHNGKKSFRCFWHKPGREYKGYREVSESIRETL